MGSIGNLAEEIKEHNAAVSLNFEERVRYRTRCADCKI